MAQFLTQAQIDSVYKLYIGYFNRAPEAGGLNYWSNYYLGQVNAGKTDAAIQKDIANQFYSAAVQYNIYSAGTPVEDFIKASYLNALGRDSVDDAGMTYWTAKLESGEVSRGEFVQKLISDAKGFASDATWGWVSKYLDNRMAVAKAFAAANTTITGDAAITAGKAALSVVTPAAVQAGQTTTQALAAAAGFTSVAGNTFTLTEGVDNIVGNANDNTIDGSLKVLAGQVLNTLGNADKVDGGAGTDTLFVQNLNTAAGGATVVAPTSVKNVEIIQLDLSNSGSAYTLNLQSGDNAVTTVKSGNNNANAASVTNVQGAVKNVELSNTNKNFTLAVAATALSGAADALALDVNAVTAGTVSLTAATGTNGYETLSITSNGSVANVLTGLTTDNSLATINVAGAQNLNLGAALNNAVTKVDANTMTGNLTVTTGTSAIAVTGGKGNDVINLDGTYTTADTINGGDGTDTLRLNSAQAIVTAAQTNVTNVETLRIGDALNGNLAAQHFSGVTTVVLDTTAAATFVTGGASTITFNAATAGNTVTINNDDTAHTLGVTINGTATTDVLNVNLRNADLGNTLTTTGAETVNLFSSTGIDGTAADAATPAAPAANTATDITMTATAANETLVITGDVALTLTGAITADTINASAMTGALTMAAATVATGGAAITGGAGGDTLFGSNANDIINGGAGADRIVGSSSETALVANQADVLTGGAGADTFVFYDTLAGAATVSNANNGSLTKITDFVAGTDKIALITGSPATSIVINTAQTVATAANVGDVITNMTALANGSVASGALQAVVVTVQAGAAAGTYLYVNDTTAGKNATNDLLINITGVSGTISAGDFLFA